LTRHRLKYTRALQSGGLAQMLEGVNAGLVAVAPVKMEGVAADGSDVLRPHVFRDRHRVEAALARHLVHALGAGAAHPQVVAVEHGLLAVAPLDGELLAAS